MSYIDKDGNTVLYRALYSVTKDGKPLMVTEYCLDDNDKIIKNPRTKAFIQEQQRHEERRAIDKCGHSCQLLSVCCQDSNEYEKFCSNCDLECELFCPDCVK